MHLPSSLSGWPGSTSSNKAANTMMKQAYFYNVISDGRPEQASVF